MDYNSIEAIYDNLKLSRLFFAVWTLCVLVTLGITIYKIGKNIKKTMVDNESIKPRDFFNALLPLVPYYLVILAVPLISSLFNTATNTLVDAVENAIPTGDFSALDQPLLDYEQNRNEVVAEKTITITVFGEEVDTGVQDPWAKLKVAVEGVVLSFLTPVTHYLYAFSLSVYFMWLLILEALSPIAALGLFYSEFKPYTHAFFKNMLACKLFLILLALSNAISVEMYALYMGRSSWTTEIGPATVLNVTGNPLVVIIVFLLLRAFLYKKSWELSNKLF